MLDLQKLQIKTDNGQTFIELPNGDVIELSLSGSGDQLYIDHRHTLDGDSLDALLISFSSVANDK